MEIAPCGPEPARLPSHHLDFSSRTIRPPEEEHVKALAAHFGFGLVTHFTRRLLLKFAQ
jgi:hypothetical protein